MDLSTLQQTVASALDAARNFTLAGSALSQPVADLFQHVFGAPAIQFSGASVQTTSPAPSATGTLSITPAATYQFLAGLTVTATFRLDETQTPQVTLAFTSAAADWGLASVVPSAGGGLLGMFRWSGCQVGFDSRTPAALPAAFPTSYGLPANSPALLKLLSKGMSFQGTAAFTGADPGLALLLGSEPFQAGGPVEWWGTAPRMDIGSAPLKTLTFGGFELPVEFHFAAVIPPVAEPGGPVTKPVATPVAVLRGTLERPTATGTLHIPFSVVAAGTPVQFVSVSGDFQDASSLGLADLATLLGVTSLDSQQGSGFPVLSGLSLERVELVVDWPAQTLLTASARVGFTPSGGPWQPFGTIFTFDGMRVTFTVIGPLESPSFQTVVDAEVTLAGGTLMAEVALPELTFSCELEPGSPPIDLTEIAKTLVGTDFGDFKLLCTELQVLGDYGNGTYRLIATVQESPQWGFSLGKASFSLSSVGFDLTRYTKGAGATAGQVVAMIEIAGVAVQISAAYEPGQAGWTFAGGTLGEQSIPLTDLVSDALTMFGLELPSTAPKVTITGLHMMLQTGNVDFGFSCTGKVDIAGKQVGIEIDLGRTHDSLNGPATTTFMGYLTIGASTFEADFTVAPDTAGLKFSWTNPSEPLSFHDIAAFFGLSVPALPENLDLALTQAEFYYDFSKGNLAVSATSRHYGQLTFISYLRPPAQGGARLGLLQLVVPLKLDFASVLPVVGDLLPAGTKAGVDDLSLLYASGQLQEPDLAAVNAILKTLGLAALPVTTVLTSGFTFVITPDIGGKTKPVVLPLSAGSPQQAELVPSAAGALAPGVTGAAAGPPSAGAKWLSLEKTFGPVSLQRIGVQYQAGVLFFLFDASLSFSGLQLGVQGLGGGSPLTGFNPTFTLDGLSVALTAGPVELNGGLLAVGSPPPNVAYEYLGELSIGIGEWQITGVGAFAKVEDARRTGHPAFFAFAQVSGEFGGPPAFFVTGFMGGLGYNCALTLPAPDQVAAFPLLAGISDPTVFGSNPAPSTVLDVLAGQGGRPAWVAPQYGSYWGAAGIMFRSFELVLGRALIVVTAGHSIDLALIGVASASLPRSGSERYAYLELQLEAVLKPDEGFFGVFASLTPNSFLLTQSCRLTGGFAFCLWSGANPHAGDFVLTVGGYHPAFNRPSWYPQVSPVGFNWVVGSEVLIRGSTYFALTPSAVMAGGNLEVTYQSGELKAWFIAWANLLITWDPFHFKVPIGISIGASYRLDLSFTTVTLSVELGASLELWGPPTGGQARVHWYVISFTVSFGAGPSDSPQQTLGWPEFEALLPGGGAAAAALAGAPAAPRAPAVLAVHVNSGLTSQDTSSGEWTVRADELVFTTESAVPASAITQGRGQGPSAPLGAQPAAAKGIDIRPMNLAGVTSTHEVTLTSVDDATTIDLTAWSPKLQTLEMAGSLWGAPLNGATPPASAETVSGATGVRLTAPPATPGTLVGPVPAAAIVEALHPGPQVLNVATQAATIPAPAAADGSIAAIATAFTPGNNLDTIENAQRQVLATLSSFAAAPATTGLTTGLGAAAGTQFAQSPMTVAG